jgi:hypothetical protein
VLGVKRYKSNVITVMYHFLLERGQALQKKKGNILLGTNLSNARYNAFLTRNLLVCCFYTN